MTISKIRLILIGGLLGVVAAGAAPGRAATAELLDVGVEVIANPTAGGSPATCRAEERVEILRQSWWLAFGRARAGADTNWEPVDGRLECGSGKWSDPAADSEQEPSVPILVVEMTTIGGLQPSSLTPERVLRMELTLTRRELAGFADSGEPEYRESVEKRSLFVLDAGEAFVPLWTAREDLPESLEVAELLLRVEAARVAADPGPAYGTISVTSEESGELLLDGGVVGTVTAGRATVLRNVRPGLRLIDVRDADGRVTRTVVRAVADRVAIVETGGPQDRGAETAFDLEPLGRNEKGYEEFRRGRDRAVVVKIPAGEFLMGNKDTEREPLEHMVYVSEFLMDKTGVTWGQYKQYAAATGTPMPPRDPYWGMFDDHPAVFVTWEEAKRYCEWAGARLPYEAEREKAARGTDERKYPWGNEEPEPHLGVFRSEWGFKATAAVGTHPEGASPYGLLDMGGNVWEWCSDWYSDDYYSVSPYRDPKGPASGVSKVLRGGSWDSRPSVLSASCRNWGHRGYREGDFGFRCAMNSSE